MRIVENDQRRIAAKFIETFFTVEADCAITVLPTAVEPVKVICTSLSRLLPIVDALAP